jgi:hypothetical protein
MCAIKPKDNVALADAVEAVANLCEDAFSKLYSGSEWVALAANSQIEHANLSSKSSTFYRSFVPLRRQMVCVLADTYRRYFKLALAYPRDTGQNADRWAVIQLQTAIHAAIAWIGDWYVLACDGENRTLVILDNVPVGPGQTTVTREIDVSKLYSPPSASPWRAPAWLFGVSLPYFGIGVLKTNRMPDRESAERLGPSHTRLLLKGAKWVFLWELGKAIETVRNEEIAAAGTVRPETGYVPPRQPNKRKGWEQRLKLYSVMKKILNANPTLEGIAFCAELDKRHAQPLYDWLASGEWRRGLTWKEAWSDTELRGKIRRVRQEAQRQS